MDPGSPALLSGAGAESTRPVQALVGCGFDRVRCGLPRPHRGRGATFALLRVLFRGGLRLGAERVGPVIGDTATWFLTWRRSPGRGARSLLAWGRIGAGGHGGLRQMAKVVGPFHVW